MTDTPAPQPETDEPLYPCPHGIPGRDCDCEIPAPVPAGRWEVDGSHRYGIRGPSGEHAWCYDAEQEQSPAVARQLADALNLALVRGSQATRPTAEDVYDLLHARGPTVVLDDIRVVLDALDEIACEAGADDV